MRDFESDTPLSATADPPVSSACPDKQERPLPSGEEPDLRATKLSDDPPRASQNAQQNQVGGVRRTIRGVISSARKIAKWVVILFTVWCACVVGLVVLYTFDGVRPVSTLMLMDYVKGNSVKRQWVPLSRVAPAVWNSAVAAEDGRFCSHSGVDWTELNNVIDSALEGERTRGASTIPMQNAKNLFLWNSRSYVRKALEIPLALFTDLAWSKRRQMEIYLNIAEWGPGIYGIEAAALHHFGRSARRLTKRQAARLVASLPNPKVRRASRPSPGLRRIASRIQRLAGIAGPYTKCLRSN